MKRAIRYLRFSAKGQSHSSIERQELYTDQWLKNNNVELVDTFADRGKSAKTFDRPDFKKLQEFIRKHHRMVDYLIVDQLDRFSRDAGDAIKLIKKLQVEFSIQIVSVTEGITYDYTKPGSFFRTGLQLLLAEEDNINRAIKARGGIYTAKAKEGRFVYSTAPFGYYKVGEKKERHLEIHKKQSVVIRFIYESFLKGVPFHEIYTRARKMGFTVNGRSAIQRVLSNPVYAGMQYVKPHQEYPGGLFPAIHEPIIDYVTWQNVQYKLKAPEKPKIVLESELPLRGVLKCYCGKLLTGAPSRGRHGKHFYYYRCNFTDHLNLSAKKVHAQLDQVLELISLSPDMVKKIKKDSKIALEQRLKMDTESVKDKQKELAENESKLFAIEEKWISNQINRETYERWFEKLNIERSALKNEIEKLNNGQSAVFSLLEKHIEKVSDLKGVFDSADILEKQELLRLMFGDTLYYKDGLLRSTLFLGFLNANLHALEEKKLYVFEGSKFNNQHAQMLHAMIPFLTYIDQLENEKEQKKNSPKHR